MEKIAFYNAQKKISTNYGFQFKIHIKQANNPTTVHYHDYYELIFIPESGLVHYVNDTKLDLPKGSLIFIRPEDCHELFNYLGDYKKSTVYLIGIHPDIINSIFSFLSPNLPTQKLLSSELPPYTVLSSYECADLVSRINYINSIESHLQDEICLYGKKVLVSIFSDYFGNQYKKNKKNDDVPVWLSSTINSMKYVENFSKGIPRMVELSGKTVEHLSRSMKKYYNTSPTEFINETRLTYIANMLINSDLSITEASYESGFQNICWMNVRFKEKFGMSPTKYRAENKNRKRSQYEQ